MNILRLMIKKFPAFPKITSPTGVRAIVFESKEETGGVQACCDDGVITQSNGSTFWIPMDRYKVTSTPTEGAAVLTDRLNAIRKEILENRFDVSKMETTTLIQSQKKFTGCSPRKKGACKCKGGRCGKRCGCCKRRNGNMSCSSSCSCNGSCSSQICIAFLCFENNRTQKKSKKSG